MYPLKPLVKQAIPVSVSEHPRERSEPIRERQRAFTVSTSELKPRTIVSFPREHQRAPTVSASEHLRERQ